MGTILSVLFYNLHKSKSVFKNTFKFSAWCDITRGQGHTDNNVFDLKTSNQIVSISKSNQKAFARIYILKKTLGNIQPSIRSKRDKPNSYYIGPNNGLKQHSILGINIPAYL